MISHMVEIGLLITYALVFVFTMVQTLAEGFIEKDKLTLACGLFSIITYIITVVYMF